MPYCKQDVDVLAQSLADSGKLQIALHGHRKFLMFEMDNVCGPTVKDLELHFDSICTVLRTWQRKIPGKYFLAALLLRTEKY